MDKNRKRWGYIFDEKLDMLIPNIPRQKKFVKIFLIYSEGSVFFLLFLAIVIKVNISFIERKLKQLEEMTLPYEFEIHPLKDNSYIFLCIILFIMFITILYFKLNELLKNFTSKDIFFVIFMIITIAVNFSFFLENLKKRKYSLIISGRIIKLLDLFDNLV